MELVWCLGWAASDRFSRDRVGQCVLVLSLDVTLIQCTYGVLQYFGV